MKTTINSVDELKSKKTGNPFWKVNDKFTVFDVDVANAFKDMIGMTAEFEVEEQGKYMNIRAMPKILAEKLNESPAEPKPASADSDRTKSIIAQCLVKAACQSGDTIEEVVKAYKRALELL